jgi:hypothetical protein
MVYYVFTDQSSNAWAMNAEHTFLVTLAGLPFCIITLSLAYCSKLPALPMAVTGELQSGARTVAGAIVVVDGRSQRNEYPAPVRLNVLADEFWKLSSGCGLGIAHCRD